MEVFGAGGNHNFESLSLIVCIISNALWTVVYCDVREVSKLQNLVFAFSHLFLRYCGALGQKSLLYGKALV